MKKDDISSSAELFLYKAEIDLNAAKYSYDGFLHHNLEIDIEKIYFDLQQAAEKLIKSLLSFHTIIAPKTHDLETLTEKLIDNSIIIEGIEKLLPLTEFAVEGRYAIILDDIDDVKYYVKIITELLVKVKSIVTG